MSTPPDDLGERAVAEQRLLRCEQLARMLLNGVAARTFLLDEDGGIVDLNEPAAASFRSTREDLIGTSLFDRLPSDLAQTRRTAIEQSLREMEPRRFVDQREGVVLETVCQPLPVGAAPKRCVVLTSLDVTTRREAERKLERSERHQRDIIENFSDAFLQTDAAGRLTMVNRAAARLFGYESAEEVIGSGTDHLWADLARRDALREEIWDGSGRIFDWIERGVRKDGSFFWGSLNAIAVRDDAGRVVGTEVVVREVTERVRTLEKIREREAQLRRIIDNMQDAFLQADLSGRLTVVSPSAAKMYRYGSVEEMIGLPAETLYADPQRREEYLRELRSSGHVHDWIGEWRRFDGSTFWGSMSGQQVRDRDGGIVGSEALVRDITERKLAEEEHRRILASLAQSDRLASMGQLAAGVAHEINNPLSYVLYNLESLVADSSHLARAARGTARTDAEPDLSERLRSALEGARKIKEIARGLSTFSRVDTEQVALVDLGIPIESALAIASNEIRYRARVDKDLDAEARVLGNEGKLSQVFLNLLINAAHAIQEGAVEGNQILVRTWRDGERVLAEIRDTGCGIPPQNLPRIFEPFFTTKPVGVGSGLGLSIVRNIVTGHGGTVEVTSEVGEGTCFVVSLPAATAAPTVDEPRPPPAAGVSVRGRVLVVDDEAFVRYALRRILRTHEVVEADGGAQACQLLSEDAQFDVILCDLMMPNMSGADFHRWLIEHRPDLAPRVLFVTGGAFTPGARTYLEQIDNLRIEKPFDSGNLQRVVAERIRAARAGRA
ncbi:MAG TPA: PAS domain S-box protein [Anaeromyxobacter sp.]